MLYTLVEAYSDDTFSSTGQTLPSTCLVEDEDGIRLLIVPEPMFPAHLWVRASASGASAILCAGQHWFWISSEDFLHTKVEHRNEGLFSIPMDALTPIRPRAWSYSELLDTIAPRPQPSSASFVHLHAHSEFSALDGLSTVDEMVQAAVDDGQPAIAVTDHGVCSAHPQLQKAAMDAGIKPIFGIEAYFVGNRHARGVEKPTIRPEPQAADFKDILDRTERYEAFHRSHELWAEDREDILEAHKAAQKAARGYNHLILWAADDRGLRNLWAMSTASYREGFYGKPRLDLDVLERYGEGVLCSTACLAGPLARPILRDDEDTARMNLGRLLNIFGDRLYAEIHTNGLEEQHRANIEILRLADEYGIPTIAAVDSHYPCADDAHTHKVWLSAQTNKELADDTDLFAGDQDYHLMGVEGVRRSLDYLPRVDEMIANTLAVADRCQAALTPRLVMPLYSKPIVGDEQARRREDEKRLVELAMGTTEDGYANWVKHCQGKRLPESAYMESFQNEMKLLVSMGFCGYFLMVWRQVKHAKDNGILVGPGRGSGASSLVAYLLGITGIDPVDAGLLFERFLTEGREEPPDFDVDYPASARDFMQDFCTEEWGAEHTMRVGTHLRLKNKGVFSDLSRVFKEQVEYRDFQEVSKIIERAEAGSAGLGLKWDDLWAQHGDELEPFKEKYPEIFDLAERLRGRLKSYGKHAAGMVISPDEVLTDSLPMRTSDNSNQPISQFDMDALTLLGYIKFDLLTLRTLDTLQHCIDLIRERRTDIDGKPLSINVYDWRYGIDPDTQQPGEYDDTQVWDSICDGHTKGIFQIETADGTRTTRKFKPRSIAELADVITLVRPGPKRSGLTDTYFRRREGFEDVSLPDPRLAEVLAPTQGCIIYQEQVMKTCQILGGYTLTEADGVRKILGKKKVDAVQAAGEEFIRRCVDYGGCDPQMVTDLWEQLGEFAKYSFNKSHAWAYAVIGYWTAWFKVHFPIEFLTAVLSTVDKDRIPEFVNEARRMRYAVLPPDINESGKGFKATTKACRFGFDGIDGVAEASTNAIVQGQPYTSFEDFMERKGPVNRKVVKALAKVGAFDGFVPNRRALVERLEWEDSEDGARCIYKDEAMSNHGLPCRFDWSSEPVQVGKSGRPLKNQKKPPKNCTKACRNYTPPQPPDWDSLSPYTPADVRDIERELFGIYLSSTPFDRWHPDVLDEMYTGSDVDLGPPGDYHIACIVNRVRPYESERAGKMAFVGLYARDLELDVVVFKDAWAEYRGVIKPDTLALARVRKTPRGINLLSFHPAPGGPPDGIS